MSTPFFRTRGVARHARSEESLSTASPGDAPARPSGVGAPVGSLLTLAERRADPQTAQRRRQQTDCATDESDGATDETW